MQHKSCLTRPDFRRSLTRTKYEAGSRTVVETPDTEKSTLECQPLDFIVVHESVTQHVDEMTDSEIEWEKAHTSHVSFERLQCP